jgi:hypothetical protein
MKVEGSKPELLTFSSPGPFHEYKFWAETFRTNPYTKYHQKIRHKFLCQLSVIDCYGFIYH